MIGCCLETKTPILVFESLVKYGTLLNHIHDHHDPQFELLSWRQRLNIAIEIAHTFAYLHVGLPRPIVYSIISSSKFLLDEHYVPKLIDFSYAECIPEGETQIKDALVRGTLGYIAPELFGRVLHEKCDELFRGVLNVKCDVYGFGSLSLELLTGQSIWHIRSSVTKDEDLETSSETKVKSTLQNFWKKIIINDKDLENNSETKVWNKIIENKCSIIEVVDPIIVGNGLCSETQHQLIVFAELAIKCLSTIPVNRPTMVDVAKQLRQLYCSAS